jgi:hypothetical protein
MRHCPPVGPEKQLTITVKENAQDTRSVDLAICLGKIKEFGGGWGTYGDCRR